MMMKTIEIDFPSCTEMRYGVLF